MSKIGHEAINSFVKHLQNGKQSFYHARGMVVGCAGAGKTSLLERMKRRNISDTEKETRAIHVTEHMFCIQKDKLFGTFFILGVFRGWVHGWIGSDIRQTFILRKPLIFSFSLISTLHRRKSQFIQIVLILIGRSVFFY